MTGTKLRAFSALLLGTFGIAPIGATAAGTSSTIFVANSHAVTAYPTGARGDVAPIAVTPDMAAPSGIAIDASGRIYVVNSATNTVTVYASNVNGDVPPLAVIGGSRARIAAPAGIGLDSRDRIYVLNKSSVTVYPPIGSDTGILDEAPIATIAGVRTLLDHPTGIALDHHGNIYVTNGSGGPVVADTFNGGTITVYPAGSNGDIAPTASLSGVHTGLAYPLGIALDSDDEIYVINGFTANVKRTPYTDGSITVYSAGSNGDIAPIATITGDKTGLFYQSGIAIDASRDIYAAGIESNNAGVGISIFRAGSHGNVAPDETIVGTDTGLNGPDGFAFDSVGNLYVSNGYGGPNANGNLTMYAAGSSGDASPMATITSYFTGLAAPSGIAVDAIGKIYLANSLGGPSESGSVNIYASGSYATGLPIATIAGDNTGLSNPYAIGVNSIGDIAVLNQGNAITVYPAGSSGDVSPGATVNIDSGGMSSSTGIAVGSHGNLYVANQGGENCNRVSCVPTSPDSVNVYPPSSEGVTRPSAVISGTEANLASPSALALDESGNIYVANQGPIKCVHACGRCFGFPTGIGSITVYDAGSDGDVEPAATIAGPSTGLKFPYAIALDSDRNIYVLNAPGFGFGCIGPVITAEATGDPILIFAAGSHGDVPPIATIHGPLTGLGLYGSAGIAIGPDGP